MASSSPKLDDIFQNAITSFEAALTEKQRREFQGCSLKDVEDTIRGIESRLASQRKQRNMRRIAKFVEGMSQLGKVIEVFVNCDVTVAFVWGPIKFVLLVSLFTNTLHAFSLCQCWSAKANQGRRHLGRDVGLPPRHLC